MKRILLEQTVQGREQKASIQDDALLENISNYITELRLLKGVPFSYLVPEEGLLPPDSIRFFYLDENWLNAFTDGALSIGRVSRREAVSDNKYLAVIAGEATRRLAQPRYRNMHKNHRRTDNAMEISSKLRTGFILRSPLVGKWKGLEICGYGKEQQLEILRMEALSSEILLCIFDGELTRFVISEPKTGLRFGAPDHTGIIVLRDVSDTSDLGKPLDKKLVLTDYADDNGRLRAADLAKAMKGQLGGALVSSPQFAFQLIAVARQGEFRGSL